MTMTPKTEPKKERTQRTEEERVAELEAQIAGIKQRAAAKRVVKEVKGSPDGVAFLATVKSMDKAIRVASESKNEAMVRVLESARTPMAEHLVGMGLRLPDRKANRGRKAKVGAA